MVAVAKSYAITATVTNGTATGANVIHTGETVALTIAANTGYNLPDTVTVDGASQTWNKETGTLTLSNPTGNVTISAACVEASKTLESGNYKWADTLSKLPVNSITLEIPFVSNSLSCYLLRVSLDTNQEYTDSVEYYFDDDSIETDFVYVASNGSKWNFVSKAYQTITLSTSQTVSATFYNWAITGGNLVKQEELSGETWVLNKSIFLSDFGYNRSYVIDFVSNNTEYKAIWTSRDSETQDITLHYTRKSDNYYQSVYVSLGTPGSPSGWINGEAYRTITFAEPVTNATLLAWLQANGTKQ